MEKFIIIADGACSKNPGPGGWGLIVIDPAGRVREHGGHEDSTTNNRMEMMGYYRGLQEVYKTIQLKTDPCIVHVITDSKYVMDGASSHAQRWSRTGWKTVAGGEVKNQDLWEKILKGQELFEARNCRIEFELVKGHSGHGGNERVDQIAVRFTHEEPIDLYEGPLAEYPVSLEKSAPYGTVYLSFVAGELKRHKTWTACQSAVHGKPSAKFKKLTNAMQEQDILKQWGLAAKT